MTAVIVNWNTRDLLVRCLESLRDNGLGKGRTEVVVVDNGSADGSLQVIAADWPEVKVIANTENVGYVRANNQAIAATDGEYVLLINTDAFLQPHALDRLVAQLDADPRAAVVGPRLVYGDGSWQRWTAGRFPSLAVALNYYLYVERLLPGWPRAQGIWLTQDVREAFRPDWVCSACMLVRRQALDEVGLLNEEYPAYVEDLEFCERAARAGWRTWYRPDAEVIHLMGQSTKLQTGNISPASIRNFNRYFQSRNGRVATRILRLAQVTGFASRAFAYYAAGRLGRGTPAMARVHWSHLKLSLERAS